MKKAYRIGLALRPFWASKGMTMEGVQQLKKLLSVPVSEDIYGDRLPVLEALGIMYFYIPNFEEAVEIFEESLAYWRQQKDQIKIGLALNNLGWSFINHGQYLKGETASLEAKSILETLSEQSILIASLTNLGWLHMVRNRPLEAIPYFERTFALTEQRGDERRNAYALTNLAFCHYLKGEYEKAEAQTNKSLAIQRKNSDKVIEGYCLMLLGFIAYAKGAFDKCEQIGRDGEKVGREVNANFVVGCAYEHRALAAFGKGDLTQAKYWNEKALDILINQVKAEHWIKKALFTRAKVEFGLGQIDSARLACEKMLANEIEQGNYRGLIPGLEIAARIAALENQYGPAARLFFNAQALREKLSTPVFQSEEHLYRDLLTELENNLPKKELILAKSQSMTEQELLSLAMRVIGQPTSPLLKSTMEKSSRPNRILAAVLFTDMVGFTALMQRDELLARRKRDRHQAVLEALHDQYGAASSNTLGMEH